MPHFLNYPNVYVSDVKHEISIKLSGEKEKKSQRIPRYGL